MLWVDQFLKNTSFSSLESLIIKNQYIDDSVVSMIIQMPGLKNLNLSNNKIKIAWKTGDLRTLLLFRALTTFSLHNNQITGPSCYFKDVGNYKIASRKQSNQ